MVMLLQWRGNIMSYKNKEIEITIDKIKADGYFICTVREGTANSSRIHLPRSLGLIGRKVIVIPLEVKP